MKDDLIEQCARAAYDATPFRSTEGPYEVQTEEYRRMCRLIARAVLAIALEDAAKVADAWAGCNFDGCAESIAARIRALATTGQEGGR